MKTILVPIDFTPVTRQVLTAAAALARDLGGRMVLLNVTRPSSVLADHDAFLDTIAGLDQPGAGPAGPRYTHEGDPDDRPVPGDSIQLIGEPVGVILEQAAQLPADYIVMGSHGHSALYDCVVGSTAAGVVKRAECPVMLVPPDRKPADAGARRILRRRGKSARTEPARDRALAGGRKIRRSPPGTDGRR
jgi:nucleotide-binding universal stress UspA family protein